MYDKTKRSNEKLVIGDVVVIKDDKINPRSKWKRGRVNQLLTGRDGVIRGAILDIYKNGVKTQIRGSLQRLVPLEVTNDHVND